MKKSIVGIVLILMSSTSYAFKWGAETKITGYYVYSNGPAYLNVASKENPDNCQRGDKYLAIDTNDKNFNALYSTIMAAYATNQNVSLNYDGCLGGYPKINAIAVPNLW